MKKIEIPLTASTAYNMQGSALAHWINCSLLNKVVPVISKTDMSKHCSSKEVLQIAYRHNRTVTFVLEMNAPQEV